MDPTSTTAPLRVDETETHDIDELDREWNVVVWNDPVNLMSYVVWVFRKLFGFSEAEATKRMLEVHEQGRSIVNTAPIERAELDCYRLHHHGLWATLERG